MASETRLETLKRYYAEAIEWAKVEPANQLYVDDLALSIELEANKPEYKMPTVMKGFEDA